MACDSETRNMYDGRARDFLLDLAQKVRDNGLRVSDIEEMVAMMARCFEEGAKMSPVMIPVDLRRCLDVVSQGGRLVSSGECSLEELALARMCYRFWVDEDHMGYVARPR